VCLRAGRDDSARVWMARRHPREVNRRSTVYRDIAQTLKDEPERFMSGTAASRSSPTAWFSTTNARSHREVF